MDNLFYIILGIVWVVYSIYTARQKALKKSQSQGMPAKGPSQSSPIPFPGGSGTGKSMLDDILRELTGELRPVPKPVSYENEPAKPRPAPSYTIPVQEVKAGSTTNISGLSTGIAGKTTQNIQKSTQKQEQLKEKFPYSKKFNLREALIYSEIMNRKYF